MPISGVLDAGLFLILGPRPRGGGGVLGCPQPGPPPRGGGGPKNGECLPGAEGAEDFFPCIFGAEGAEDKNWPPKSAYPGSPPPGRGGPKSARVPPPRDPPPPGGPKKKAWSQNGDCLPGAEGAEDFSLYFWRRRRRRRKLTPKSAYPGSPPPREGCPKSARVPPPRDPLPPGVLKKMPDHVTPTAQLGPGLPPYRYPFAGDFSAVCYHPLNYFH